MKFRSFFVFSLALAFVFSACTTTQKEDKDRRISKSRLLIEAASASLVEGDATGALQYLERAEKEDVLNPDLYHVRGMAYRTKGNLQQALKDLERAVEMNPSNPAYASTLGKVLVDAGKYQEAQVHLERAARDPRYRGAYKALTSLGIRYYRTQEWETAERNFVEAIRADANASCVAYYYLGNLRFREKRFQEAFVEYEKASQKLCGGFADAHFAMGLTLERLQRVDEAKKKYLDIQAAFSGTPYASKAVERIKALP
jgi:Tfp pilus assembly protein PilF